MVGVIRPALIAAAVLDWSVESQPEKATGSLEDADVTIAGIYSKHDKKSTFMAPCFDLQRAVCIR